MMKKEERIVIIGAGPCGLGAGWRLSELGHDNWIILEKEQYVGGLSASFTDEKGFTYDIGGHVMFSHYPYFDRVVEEALRGDYLEHQRESWIWLTDRFIPYPFQNNIRYLPKRKVIECLVGLAECWGEKRESRNFHEWILNTFGKGIARYFMLPYNRKNWGFPLTKMDHHWIAERVSVVDFKRVLTNVLYQRDDVSWGPNATFKFPLFGGTGGLFSRIADFFRDRIRLGEKVVGVDLKEKKIYLENGKSEPYDFLISTMPLDRLAEIGDPIPNEVKKAGRMLSFNGGLIVGVAFSRPTDSTKCWMYFPEKTSPFYRVTYLSNYSPKIVPDIKRYFLLLAETTYSRYRRIPKEKIVELTLEGFLNTKLIKKEDLKRIAATYTIEIDHSYPIPTLKRNEALRVLHPFFEAHNVLSRGRFGGYLYEIGNMDHSFMQGKEAVDRILLGKEETVWRLPGA